MFRPCGGPFHRTDPTAPSSSDWRLHPLPGLSGSVWAETRPAAVGLTLLEQRNIHYILMCRYTLHSCLIFEACVSGKSPRSSDDLIRWVCNFDDHINVHISPVWRSTGDDQTYSDVFYLVQHVLQHTRVVQIQRGRSHQLHLQLQLHCFLQNRFFENSIIRELLICL